MSEYELHFLIADLNRDMDHLIEFWLSGTFAVIVARFVARDLLTRTAIWVMTVLYLAATGVSIARYAVTYSRSVGYRTELVSRGFEPFFTTSWAFFSVTTLYTVLVAGMTAGTLYFLHGGSAFKRET